MSRLTRWQFVRGTAAAAAAGGAVWAFAQQGATKEASTAHGLIDTHIYLGRWPFARQDAEHPSELAELLRRNGVVQAWTGTFEALFHKDISAANERLTAWCHDEGKGMLVPFGAVNPLLPDWEEDVRRCAETFQMPGIRLHPKYHGYELDDPRFVHLLALAEKYKLLVQIVAGLDDRRRPFLSLPSTRAALSPLIKTARAARETPIILNSALAVDDRDALTSLSRIENVFFDCQIEASRVGVDTAAVNANRIVFGSCAPLYGFAQGRTALESLQLAEGDLRRVKHATAQRLLARDAR